jgi:hypothetical protein
MLKLNMRRHTAVETAIQAPNEKGCFKENVKAMLRCVGTYYEFQKKL